MHGLADNPGEHQQWPDHQVAFIFPEYFPVDIHRSVIDTIAKVGIISPPPASSRRWSSADRALSSVNRALSSADRALSSADRALSSADHALSSADHALSSADHAWDTVDVAWDTV
ncbi:MAG: hypothetical protein LBD64_01135, partial [Odoribacteraceae bacterium]|nr:hypothetical protein [Odoribacteraceae bacterium]